MKKLVITLSVSLIALTQSFANNNPEISKMIEEAVQFEEGVLPMEKDEAEFVKMSLKVNKLQKLEILDANFSDTAIGEMVFDRITALEIEEDLLTDDTLYYHIIFRKL